MKKHFRLLSIFLVLILSFSLFSVNAFAVEDTENLVDGNLSNWTDYSDESEYFQSADVSYLDNNVNYIEISSSDTSVYLFDVTEFLKIGESYNFSFNLPTTDGANSTSLDSCILSWSLTDGGGSSYPTYGSDVFLINIDKNNKSNYLGKTTVFEFTYTQGFQNTFLCLAINPGENLEVYNDLELYISNISLERVTTESEKKLDGILGWLQDIWDKLTTIGDKLTDVWTNITSSVSALGDRISSFFSELGSKISTEFTNLTSDFSGYISSLGDRFSGFITSLGDRISGFFENLSVNISGFFTDLLDGIKEFFKGFGNLILYFNWEGEFENPFVYEHSLIGDFVGSGEDDEEENENILKLDGSWRHNYTSDGTAEFTCNDGVYKLVRYAGNRYFKFFYNGTVPMKPEHKTILHFTTYDYNISDSSLTLRCEGYGSYKIIDFSGPGTYSIELPSYSSENSFSFYIYDYRTDNGNFYSNDLNYWIYIKDLYVEYVSIYDDGSTGDTGSDEEGTTEKKSVSQFFDDLVEYLSGVSDDIETVIDSITGPVVLLDEFTKRFEWLFGIVTFVLMMIVASRFIGL